jgi:hypothetical protein
MITYLARKHGLAGRAQPIPVFYPVPYDRAEMLFGPAEEVERLVTPDSRAIHMWNSRLHKLAERPPPPGSYVGELCDRLDVPTS